MRDTKFPIYTPTNYRTGQNANEYFAYGPGLKALTSNDQTLETRLRPDSYFLCKKIHTQTLLAGSGAVVPSYGSNQNPLMRLTDGRLGRSFQSQAISFATVGGLAACPNILAAPILFEPASVVSMQYLNGSGITVGLSYEGEKVYNPDPAWVRKMRSRFWYQYAIVDTTNTQPLTLNLDLKDPDYDFAICRIMSFNLSQGEIVNSLLTGRLRMREKGPNNMYWSNLDLPDRVYAGLYGIGFGAHNIMPPIIVPGTSQLEIFYKAVSGPNFNNISYFDLVFDGIKFPRGSNLEDWL